MTDRFDTFTEDPDEAAERLDDARTDEEQEQERRDRYQPLADRAFEYLDRAGEERTA